MASRIFALKRTQRVGLAVFCIWSIFIMLFNHFILNFSADIALYDSLATNILLALGCLTLGNLLGYYQPTGERVLYAIGIAFILSLIICYLTNQILSYLISDTTFISYLKITLPFRFLLVLIILSCCAFVNTLWYRLEEQSAMQERLLATQCLAKEAELNKLRHQLQPHFLFNSLNSVYALTIVNPKEAGTMITKLAAFLRGNLKRDDDVWVTVAEEMEYIQLYLDIEKVRFSHRLNIQVHIDEQSYALKLPGTLLQPIVENAIKFGLYNTSATTNIVIDVAVNQNMLYIKVQNPFDPLAKADKGTGFGLKSIRRRLYLLFADHSLLETASTENNEFVTTLKIPQHDKSYSN
jgi:two-component system LytT family sensor kinase